MNLAADVWSRLASLNLSERDRRDIADVTTGVHTEAAAVFLLAHLKAFDLPQTELLRFTHHVARYGAAALMPELVALAVADKRPPAERLEILKAVQQGTQERGLALDKSSRRLAARLAGQL